MNTETGHGPGPAPEVSVIVVTHDSAGEVPACLESLRRHRPGLPHEVIVVDNASVDGTGDLVEREYPEAHLVRAPRRRGFAANCNAGAKMAKGRILFLLNPDARVMAGSIDCLVSYLDAHPTVAIAGPRLIYPDGSPQSSARRFPTVTVTLLRRSPLRLLWRHSEGERRHLMLDTTLDRPATVDWLLGAALAMPSSVYRDLGGMDESYRLYCEDIDLCHRVWDAGLGVVFVPGTVVEHDLSELTRRRFLTRATIWHMTSMARYVRRHGLRHPQAHPGVRPSTTSETGSAPAPTPASRSFG